MSHIKISKLSFHYENSNQNIFSNLNLDLDSSWKLGLVGRNGRGKTTFLNLLCGRLQGLGDIQSDLTFSYYPVQIKNPEEITLFELQNQVAFEEWKLERELNMMHMDPALLWQPFNTLSGGEQTKVLLALSFTDRDAFPLIDEPTNHLDEDSRSQIAAYLNKHDKGYIVVSHDRSFLNQVTDHILAIENKEIHLYQGNFATYEDTKHRRDEFNRKKNEKLKHQISNLNRQKVQFHNWAASIEAKKHIGMKTQYILNRRSRVNGAVIGHEAAKMMKKSLSARNRMNKRIEAKKGLMTNIEKISTLTMNLQPNYHQNLLEIKDLSLSFKDGKKLFHNLNLNIKNSGIVAIKAKNGSGKTSLIRFLLKQLKDFQYSGKCDLIKGLKISYLPQGFVEYTGTLKDFAKVQKISYEELLNNLKKMGFSRNTFDTPIEEMSMGQQKRVALAKSLVEPANLYLWDEPANYLDVFNQDQLINLLQTVKPAMLLIEHDQYFIDQVAAQKVNLNCEKY